ncbi:MAG: ABC-F family ATP-binding cassette domain-containing protein [Alphaproteobacteria bacterium]|nr:ABC-F family ATP-binding cassette domain-containing protein [Alphaproteobacteria bacterium]
MAPPILKLDDIALTFGGEPLLNGASFQVEAGDRLCLVGRNGSGKSTLLKIAAGLSEAQSGEIFRHPSVTIRYLEQAPDFGAFETVRSYAEAGLGPGDDAYRVQYLLDQLGLTGDEDPHLLSGGEARRAALAQVMAPEPDILLLDEPTNHLDLPVIEWLEGELQRMKSAIVLISHDRRFLENISRSTLWLDRGVIRRMDKRFSAFESWRDKLLEEEALEQHKLGRAIVREEHWLRYGVTARRKRNVRRLGELHAMRERHRTHRGPTGTVEVTVSDVRDSGKLVIEAKSINMSFGDRTIVKDFSIRVHKGDRIGLVGRNGAGKTTLLNLLTGVMEPDSGSLRLGANLEMVTLDQKRDDLDPNETLEHFLTDGRGGTLAVNGQQRHVTGYMKDFLFQPEQARTPVRELSGGERARLILARNLARPANLIVLDEPTNDLDMETLDLLQELIAGFAGTVILVSHDRDFLDRTVTSIIAPADPQTPNGQWLHFAGGYSDMLAQRKETTTQGGRSKPKSTGQSARSDTRNTESPGRKLSYKQKFALESLPEKISETESAIVALEEKMAAPDFFATDPDGFSSAAKTLSDLRSSLERMEEEWLELEMLRESLEGKN